MATIYRAYANGEEITGFPINGVETQEIWGGDTLLWKKNTGVDFPYIYKMIHCGKRTVVFFLNSIVVVENTPPYYKEIFKRPNFDPYYRDYGFYTSVFNEELYILPIRYKTDTSEKVITLYLDGFYIFSNEMKLRKKYDGLDIDVNIGDIEIGASSGKYVRPFKVWVENERFHLALVYYKSTFIGGGSYDYEPIWFKNLVFEKGELSEQQNEFTSNSSQLFDYGDANNYDPNTVVIPYNNGYSIAFDEISNEDRLVEVSVKSSDMKRIYGRSNSSTSSDYFFAGCHNGKFLWFDSIDRKIGIYEFTNNNFVLKCNCEAYPRYGFVPHNDQYVYTRIDYGETGRYAIVKSSKNSLINNDNPIIYKSKESIFVLINGVILENGFVYIFYNNGSKMRMEFFKI